MSDRARLGASTARWGLLVNVGLVLTKLLAGVIGNAYVLIADAVESSIDIFSSLVVWHGLRIASRPADDNHPFGHGKAEPLAAAVVSMLLLGAAVGIAVVALREIRSPQMSPAPFTLVVAASVIVIKESLYRRTARVAAEIGGSAAMADAWHHRSDAITSAAAFAGIAVAVLGGPGWESADDWAALVASVVIVAGALRMLRPALRDLMDEAPGATVAIRVAEAARAVPGVLAIEKLRIRGAGLDYLVDVHVQANPTMTLRDAHVLSGKVKNAIRGAVPAVTGVLVHMEPYEPTGQALVSKLEA